MTLFWCFVVVSLLAVSLSILGIELVARLWPDEMEALQGLLGFGGDPDWMR